MRLLFSITTTIIFIIILILSYLSRSWIKQTKTLYNFVQHLLRTMVFMLTLLSILVFILRPRIAILTPTILLKGACHYLILLEEVLDSYLQRIEGTNKLTINLDDNISSAPTYIIRAGIYLVIIGGLVVTYKILMREKCHTLSIATTIGTKIASEINSETNSSQQYINGGRPGQLLSKDLPELLPTSSSQKSTLTYSHPSSLPTMAPIPEASLTTVEPVNLIAPSPLSEALTNLLRSTKNPSPTLRSSLTSSPSLLLINALKSDLQMAKDLCKSIQTKIESLTKKEISITSAITNSSDISGETTHSNKLKVSTISALTNPNQAPTLEHSNPMRTTTIATGANLNTTPVLEILQNTNNLPSISTTTLPLSPTQSEERPSQDLSETFAAFQSEQIPPSVPQNHSLTTPESIDKATDITFSAEFLAYQSTLPAAEAAKATSYEVKRLRQQQRAPRFLTEEEKAMSIDELYLKWEKERVQSRHMDFINKLPPLPADYRNWPVADIRRWFRDQKHHNWAISQLKKGVKLYICPTCNQVRDSERHRCIPLWKRTTTSREGLPMQQQTYLTPANQSGTYRVGVRVTPDATKAEELINRISAARQESAAANARLEQAQAALQHMQESNHNIDTILTRPNPDESATDTPVVVHPPAPSDPNITDYMRQAYGTPGEVPAEVHDVQMSAAIFSTQQSKLNTTSYPASAKPIPGQEITGNFPLVPRGQARQNN